jgi:hypothetical protein
MKIRPVKRRLLFQIIWFFGHDVYSKLGLTPAYEEEDGSLARRRSYRRAISVPSYAVGGDLGVRSPQIVVTMIEKEPSLPLFLPLDLYKVLNI